MDPAQKRRIEIQAKKAKLAELKKLRGERQLSFPIARSTSGLGEGAAPSPSPRLSDRKDINDLVNSLVGDVSASRKSSRPSSRVSSGQHNTDGERDPISAALDAGLPRPETKPDDVRLLSSSTESRPDSQSQSNSEFKVPKPIVHDSVLVTAVAIEPTKRPKERVTYSKGTQTQNDQQGTDFDSDEEDKHEIQEKLIKRLRQEIEAELRTKAEEDERLRKSREIAVAVQVPESSAVEPKRSELDHSIDTTTTQATGPTPIDYTQDPDVEPDSGEGRLKEMMQFGGTHTIRRMVTSIDWSPRYKELLMASYSKTTTFSSEVQGLVLVWNCRAPHRPEFTFHCQSEVQKSVFSPFHPNYIIGGSYSGQVMLWDTRANSEAVLKTPLTGKGHTYPITGLDIIGTRQANSIVSTSSDGTVCTWSMDMLAQPQETIELALQPPSKVEEVAPTAVSHTSADTSTFLVGTEDGNVYSVNRQDRAGAKAGIDPKILYKGHFAMVTGAQHHPKKGPIDMGDLFLTSSLDWTIKLWRLKSSSPTAAMQASNGPVIQTPLLEFQRDDMVYDVSWSPQRPGVLASVDGTGECHVYDICQSHEVSLAKATPSAVTGSPASQAPRALNKVAWDHDEGKRLAVGGVDGALTIFEVPSTLGGKEGTNNDQWYVLGNKLKAMGR